MRFFLRRAVVGAVCVAALAVPAAATAAPPPNDDYLASTTIAVSEYAESVDTTEATTQADLFKPNPLPFTVGPGDREPTTSCATTFGKTVWWDFHTPDDGRAEVRVAGGFDLVVAVYETDPHTFGIKYLITCRNDTAGGETVPISQVRNVRNYIVQVGGAQGTGGPVQFRYSFTAEPGPVLRLASARLRVASALRDWYPSAFRGHKRFRRSCYRISRHRVGCNFRWDKGAYRYTGKVWFRNDRNPPAIDWTDAHIHRKRIARVKPRSDSA